ncbi:hypothetical protein [Actinopolymorpha rutila]|uniref:Thiamine transporter ThiT n=1 Tax=Actinopolymorpha rutila TaxID=446787 RepID=A0A852ZFJ2_9ACTN|nr:hypothetical protein [Actinopolymorpha rutila]NYH91941.1 thiamine transporter ThiT [Actinopolymorpha rutila]
MSYSPMTPEDSLAIARLVVAVLWVLGSLYAWARTGFAHDDPWLLLVVPATGVWWGLVAGFVLGILGLIFESRLLTAYWWWKNRPGKKA